MNVHNLSRYFFVIVLGALLFLPFLGHVHLFDWDEINFAECAREMIVSHDYLKVQIDFKPFWEKPPLFIWLLTGAFALLGPSEATARLVNIFAGTLTIPLVAAGAQHLWHSRGAALVGIFHDAQVGAAVATRRVNVGDFRGASA